MRKRKYKYRALQAKDSLRTINRKLEIIRAINQVLKLIKSLELNSRL